MQSKALVARLRGQQAVYGGWTVIADPLAAAAMAGAGLDYVVIDLQHGAATEKDLPALTRAITLAGAAPVARVRYAHPADIGRALDLGCEGVIVPNVESAAQAEQAAGACRYPPAGYRSGGGALTAPSEPFCIIMVESTRAVTELSSTLAINGVDGIYVGPRDLSYSLGCELDPDDPVLSAALEQIWVACAQAGKPVGVHSTDGATARRYAQKGCRLINVASDIQTISRGCRNELTAARQ
ncbi:MAG TPA: aldolase/citrate lyase family protein [Streptosporangiaceae bacterium]|jgi:4-hydroxy-2-oxoheptanedioate aldolase|nr:aldolase/citrate lyase family protein [Streptosporangiaceae bacterium]